MPEWQPMSLPKHLAGLHHNLRASGLPRRLSRLIVLEAARKMISEGSLLTEAEGEQR